MVLFDNSLNKQSLIEEIEEFFKLWVTTKFESTKQ